MLTETKIKAAKPRSKPYKLFDGGGSARVVAVCFSAIAPETQEWRSPRSAPRCPGRADGNADGATRLWRANAGCEISRGCRAEPGLSRNRDLRTV
jgi:hypothetical protein